MPCLFLQYASVKADFYFSSLEVEVRRHGILAEKLSSLRFVHEASKSLSGRTRELKTGEFHGARPNLAPPRPYNRILARGEINSCVSDLTMSTKSRERASRAFDHVAAAESAQRMRHRFAPGRPPTFACRLVSYRDCPSLGCSSAAFWYCSGVQKWLACAESLAALTGAFRHHARCGCPAAPKSKHSAGLRWPVEDHPSWMSSSTCRRPIVLLQPSCSITSLFLRSIHA